MKNIDPVKVDPKRIQALKKVYQSMVASRESDIVEAELVKSGEANFLAASYGHEGSAALAPFLIPADYLHCHYRDKALMLARGLTNEMIFKSALCKADSHSTGRQMVSHMSAPELHMMSLVGPVGNNALQAAGVAKVIKDQPEAPIVLCAIGDGTSQQGEVLEGIAEAVRDQLPVLFFIHNNELAISTRTTGKTFFSLPGGVEPSEFYGLPILRLEGTHPMECMDDLASVISAMRHDRKPQLVIFNVDRLANHSNADDQKLYRSDAEICQSHDDHDPIKNSEVYLMGLGIPDTEIQIWQQDAKAQVRAAVEVARASPEPVPTFVAERPLLPSLLPSAPEFRGDFEEGERYTMIQAMREVLRYQLSTNPDVILLGEDLEDGKGDVFGVTRGLSTQFPGRVRNSALSESTIMGLSVGMALAGARPVAFMQFADFMPLAYNQLYAEVGSMFWRTNGGWECPVIVMAACGGYRPGLGPFHSQTNEGTWAHIPGVDVMMPSTAADAAGMLNAAFASRRPTVILYPKRLLNNSSVQDTTSKDIEQRWIPIGKARIVKPGQDITLIGWGNTVEICLKAADALETPGIAAEVIDLRTIKPYDVKTLLNSVERTGKVIVVHEDNHTCGLGGDVLATLLEQCSRPIQGKRVTRPDTFVPCNFANQIEVLPSVESVLKAAADLLDLDVSFDIQMPTDDTRMIVNVIGASPSDESVNIVEFFVKVGDHVKSGQKLVDIEASKSAGEILAPAEGVVEEIFAAEADQVKVGLPLLSLKLDHRISPIQMALRTVKRPILKRKHMPSPVHSAMTGDVMSSQRGLFPVGLSAPLFKTGSRQVSNDDILKKFPGKQSEDIVNSTGIESRYWLAEDESIVTIAADVAEKLLKSHGLGLTDISMIICATSTPEQYISPSMACLVLNRLYAVFGECAIPAWDINAACSGYLYALSQAKDYAQTRPHARVLVLTAEALSRRLNDEDFDTAFLFGDAATATLVLGAHHMASAKASIGEFSLSSLAEDGAILNVPCALSKQPGIRLEGRKLFTFAVKNMAMAIQKCCQQAHIPLESLHQVIPHQANQRISDAVERRLELPSKTLYSNIARYGNTSSCTIAIGLAEALPSYKQGQHIGLVAFGGGFTYGAVILTIMA